MHPESRGSDSGDGAGKDEELNTQSDEALEQDREIHQHKFTWRRLPKDPGREAVYSRLDRVYTNLQPDRARMAPL